MTHTQSKKTGKRKCTPKRPRYWIKQTNTEQLLYFFLIINIFKELKMQELKGYSLNAKVRNLKKNKLYKDSNENYRAVCVIRI